MTWLNWLLKLHSGLRCFPYLIHTYNTQDFCSMNAYFICVIVPIQMWCIYSIACWSNPKRFLSILYVLKVFSCFRVLSFCSNCIFNVFHQKHFHRSSQVSSFCKNVLGKKWKHQISNRNSHNCFATKGYPWKFLCFRSMFCK